MPRRAPNGVGSVFRLKDGSWRAACPTGKPSFRGRTQAEAIRRREVYLKSHQRFLVRPHDASDATARVISEWLDSRRDSLRPRTVESYHDTAKRYIIPAIGHIPISH